MVRALLISYPGYPYTPSSLLPDNGLANLAGSLIEAGHEALVLDYGTVDAMRRLVPPEMRTRLSKIYERIRSAREKGNRISLVWHLAQLRILDKQLARHRKKEVGRIAEELAEIVRNEKPDFVGFKLWNGDGFDGPLEMAKYLKTRFPHLKIFAGGPHVDFFRSMIFQRTGAFDGLIYGEGEEAILHVAEYVSGKAKLDFSNLITPDGREREIRWIDNLDGLPMPVYDENVYPAMKGNQKIKIVVLDESRGCPYKCAFCVQPVKSGSKRRVKSAGRVIREMKHIIDASGIRTFRYAGSSTPAKLMREIAEKILQQKLDVIYCSYGHVREFRRHDAEILKESGLSGLLFGIESGSQIVLDRMNKPTTVEQIKSAVTEATNAGIFVVGSVILPAPGDKEETMNQTFELLTDIRPDSVFIQFPGIYPRTPWETNPEQYGFNLNKTKYRKKVMNYKIKTLFPPSFWSPLPYKLNGMSFRKFSRITERFASELESHGLVTQLTDDIALMGAVLGITPGEFKEITATAAFAGDWERMSEIVTNFNGKTHA